MTKKTDIISKKDKPSRRNFDCDELLKVYFALINSFPKISDWVTFEYKGFPSSPYFHRDSETLFTKKPAKNSEFSELEKQEIDKLLELGRQLLIYLRGLNSIAMNFVIHQQELDTLAGYHQKEGASYQKVEAAINRYVKNPHSLQAEISIKYEDYLKICDEGYESGRIVEFWLSRYSLVKAIKGLFDNLAFRGRNLESSPKNMNARDFGYFNALTPKIWIDEKGLVQKADAHILTVLIGKDITRIRQCAVCRNFFWANRKDRKCCSKKCADVNNQRNIRSKKKDNECLYKNPKKIMTSKKECSKVF